MKRITLFVPFLLFIGLGFFLFRGLSLDPKELPSALIGKQFPAFTAEKIDGTAVSEKDLLGEVSLVNVWATWCPTCKQEHAYLNKLASEGIKIFGVNYKDETDKAVTWLEQLGNPYVFNIKDEDGMLGLDLGVYGAPETYLLDKNGVVRLKHVGDVNERVWKTKIEPEYRKWVAQ
ncbi:DsbE family thiol:disulfide interchange protein [Litoribrevibacter albus]|uniref:Thiol:disulfide interchange protein DsbE n=1 Tax=Litoribrevibacter albus TaxID=1473156 RepID=A0AA37SAG1_9GAMM|nr:DsbE family thiol:disulfide interchange protein [Litoribrevibacter albus]GLQ32377.1 thiol:disulfide interchange protein DsbE [Litoribrevibacter albus]